MGISFCFFLHHGLVGAGSCAGSSPGARQEPARWRQPLSPWAGSLSRPIPLWKKALDTRTYYYLYKWHWYEWLGALAPLVSVLAAVARCAKTRRNAAGALCAGRVCSTESSSRPLPWSCSAFRALVRLTPLQPMRYLHLVYFFLALIAGCLLGKVSCSRPRLALGGLSCWSSTAACLPRSACSSAAASKSNGPAARRPIPGFRPLQWIRENTPTERLFCPRSALSCGSGRGLSQLPRAGRAQPTGRCNQGHGSGNPDSRARPGCGNARFRPRRAGRTFSLRISSG